MKNELNSKLLIFSETDIFSVCGQKKVNKLEKIILFN